MIVLTLALLWLSQVVLFDFVYSNVRTGEVETTARHVKLSLNDASFYKTLADASGKNDICAEVVSPDGSVVFDAENSGSCLVHSLTQSERLELIGMVSDSALFSITYDPITEEYHVESLGTLVMGGSNILYVEKISHNGDTVYLVLDATVAPVGTVKKATASFLITLSFLLLIVAGILANYTAKRIADPIGAISKEAKKLSFGKYSPVESNSTEIDELNDSLVAAAQDLKKLEHDLRTPLTLISGYAEMMRDMPSEVTEENLTTILDETRRLSSLVNDMLDISLIENGKRTPKPVTFSLTEAIRDTLSQYRELTAKDGYQFIYHGDCEVFVTADRAMILQVVSNLLNNAMTYTGDDKTVTVTQLVECETVRIEIADTGYGIPPDQLPLIWERYYKIDDAHKRAVRGTGLGLSIVKTVISTHGGRYGVRSTLGVGSVFWFELPTVPAPETLA